MSSTLEIVAGQILQPTGLGIENLDKFLGGLHSNNVNAGDLYFQTSQQESWVMDDGIIREGSFNIEKGVGVRAISGEKTGFAYCDDLQSNAITQAVKNARAIAKQGQEGGSAIALNNQSYKAFYTGLNPVDGRSADDKVELLKQLDGYTRSLDERIEQVIISLAGGIDHILVAATDGTLALEAFRHVAVDDAPGKPLDDRGLADAGLADQYRVVLRAS